MRATQILVLGLLTVASGAASAGELAAISRGTVAISISVPPHIIVTPASLASENPQATQSGFCVATNGFQSFHLMVVDTTRSSRQTISNPTQIQLGKIGCGGSGREFEVVTDEPAGEVQMLEGAQPLTVLVVPD